MRDLQKYYETKRERLPKHLHRDKKRAAIRAHRSQLGEIVTDDPSGFILPAAFIAKFIGEHEIFWRMP